MNSEDGQVYSVCILQFSCFTKYNRMQSKHKQIVNIADETLTDYSFLIRYHYTKSKNYLKRRYRIRHWIPMFIGTPCTLHPNQFDSAKKWVLLELILQTKNVSFIFDKNLFLTLNKTGEALFLFCFVLVCFHLEAFWLLTNNNTRRPV